MNVGPAKPVQARRARKGRVGDDVDADTGDDDDPGFAEDLFVKSFLEWDLARAKLKMKDGDGGGDDGAGSDEQPEPDAHPEVRRPGEAPIGGAPGDLPPDEAPPPPVVHRIGVTPFDILQRTLGPRCHTKCFRLVCASHGWFPVNC